MRMINGLDMYSNPTLASDLNESIGGAWGEIMAEHVNVLES
jgi:Mn-containing catalase